MSSGVVGSMSWTCIQRNRSRIGLLDSFPTRRGAPVQCAEAAILEAEEFTPNAAARLPVLLHLDPKL